MRSPSAALHAGFSAGSFRDMTRVAELNPRMWTELFLENRENLLHELDDLLESLEQYRDALDRSDAAVLNALLEDGSQRKKEIGTP